MGCPQLPLDCLLEILEKLTDDTKSLYPCLLVNRIWFQTAVPILWKKPLHDDFSFKFNQNQWNSLSRTIFYCIPKENLEFLQKNLENISTNNNLYNNNNCEDIYNNNNNINHYYYYNPNLQQQFNFKLKGDEKKLMFNYIEFIQYISTESIQKLITCLLSNPFIDRKIILPPKFSYTHNETLLEKELWKIFMKYNITLKHLEHPIFPIFIYSNALLRLNCLTHLECSPVDLGTLIFDDLSSFCQNLEKLSLNYKNGVAESVGNGINRSISNFILKQNGLKEIEFYCPNFTNSNGDNSNYIREFKREFNKFIGKSLLKHKYSLKIIIFKENIFISSKILNQLSNIKRFEFKGFYCHPNNPNQNNNNNNNNNNSILNRISLVGLRNNNNNNFILTRDLSNLEHINWLNLESLNIDGITMDEFEYFIKLIEGTSTTTTNTVITTEENENENIENETENEHDSDNEQQDQQDQVQAQMAQMAQIESQQQQQQQEEQQQEEEEQQHQEHQQQQQQQQQQVINNGLLLKQISIETDSLIPKSEHIKSYYQSLIRYCPNLEVVTIWYLDEYKNDFESLIKSCQNLKEITLIFADNLLGNNDINDDATLSFIFNTLLNYVDDNFTVLNFGEGWKINVKILYEFLQQWKDKKPLFIWYHMETDIFDDHLRVFENFKELGVLKGWKRYF